MPYFPTGADGELAIELSASAFKKAVRARLAEDPGAGPVVVATLRQDGSLAINGHYGTVDAARALFAPIVAGTLDDRAVYAGIFERAGTTWAEIDTERVARRPPIAWKTAAVVAVAGVGVLWWLAKKGRSR